MKPSTLVALIGPASAAAAGILARQRLCSEDNCYRALWEPNPNGDHPLSAFRDCQDYLTTTVAIFPIVTLTVVGRTTTTLTALCSVTPSPLSSSTSSLTTSVLSLPEFTFPDPTTSTTSTAVAVIKARQDTARSSSTTTILGTIPSYAATNCGTVASVYTSACSCKQVTQATITLLSTTLTDTETFTLTSTTTTIASCDTSPTVTSSSGSSTTTATLTTTSNTDGTFTGTGTVSSSSLSLTSTTSTSLSSTSSSPTSLSPTPSNSISSSSTSSSSTSSSSNTSSSATSTPSPTTTSTPPTTTPSTTTSTALPPICSGTGTLLCSGLCQDTKTSPLHCGRCNNACAPNLSCINGVCAREPCDSTCTFTRFCNAANNSTSGCMCATDASHHGVCFDRDRYQCSDGNLIRCLQTEISEEPGEVFPGCPVGMVCVKEVCNCNDTGVPEAARLGICVSTVGCGEQGVLELGALVRVGEGERRRRMVGGL